MVWVGNMCKKVLSVGFKLYKNDELDIKKVKVFCSENILRNLIQLPPIQNPNALTAWFDDAAKPQPVNPARENRPLRLEILAAPTTA